MLEKSEATIESNMMRVRNSKSNHLPKVLLGYVNIILILAGPGKGIVTDDGSTMNMYIHYRCLPNSVNTEILFWAYQDIPAQKRHFSMSCEWECQIPVTCSVTVSLDQFLEYFISFHILFIWAVHYHPILPPSPTSEISILFWQNIVDCLLSLQSKSTLLQSSSGFFQYLFALLPPHSSLKHFSIVFLPWFYLRVIGVLNLLRYLVQVFITWKTAICEGPAIILGRLKWIPMMLSCDGSRNSLSTSILLVFHF